MVDQTYPLNMIPGGPALRVRVSQYDAGSRTLFFRLHAGSVAFSVPAGAALRVTGTRPDGLGFSLPAAAAGAVVSLEVDGAMTAVGGTFPCQLRITQDGALLGSALFLLQVETAALAAGTPMADPAPAPLPQTSLTAAQVLILRLSDLMPGLDLGFTIYGDTAAAEALFAQVRTLTQAGFPVVTPISAMGMTALCRVQHLSADPEAKTIVYTPMGAMEQLGQLTVTITPGSGVSALLEPCGDGYRHWAGTRSAYEALGTYETDTLYFVAEDET